MATPAGKAPRERAEVAKSPLPMKPFEVSPGHAVLTSTMPGPTCVAFERLRFSQWSKPSSKKAGASLGKLTLNFSWVYPKVIESPAAM